MRKVALAGCASARQASAELAVKPAQVIKGDCLLFISLQTYRQTPLCNVHVLLTLCICMYLCLHSVMRVFANEADTVTHVCIFGSNTIPRQGIPCAQHLSLCHYHMVVVSASGVPFVVADICVADPNYCNGHATKCLAGVCTCKPGYTGTRCETAVELGEQCNMTRAALPYCMIR